MSQPITVRLSEELAAWIEESASRTGLSQGQVVRQHLERARSTDTGAKKFMRLAGSIKGARDLSTRKGFAKP